jgi:hypothetical protein
VVTFAFTCLLQGQYRAGLELFAEGLAIELSEASLVVRQGDRAFRRPVADNAKAKADRDFIDAAAGRPDRILCPYRDAVKTQRLALAITDAIEVRDPA